MTTGRNQPCPCGSGQKYKHCCQGKQKISKNMIALVAVIALIAAVGVAASFLGRKPATTTPGANRATSSQAGRPQPGPAPPGKVWSPEHGHWHDAAPGQQTQTAAIPGRPAQTTPSAPVPQPAGTPPPGKVWSPEHGHWHDAPK